MTYYIELLSKGTRGAYVALAVHAIVVIFMIWQSIMAYGRGASRSVARLLSVGGCAVVAFYVTRKIGRKFLARQSLAAIIPLSSTKLSPILGALSSEVLLPFVFAFLFLSFSFLIVLPYKLFCGIFGFSYMRNNLGTRWFAVLVGSVHALLTCFILLLPFFGCARLYEKAAIEKPNSAVASLYDRYLEDTVESPLYQYSMGKIGNRALNSFAASTKPQ